MANSHTAFGKKIRNKQHEFPWRRTIRRRTAAAPSTAAESADVCEHDRGWHSGITGRSGSGRWGIRQHDQVGHTEQSIRRVGRASDRQEGVARRNVVIWAFLFGAVCGAVVTVIVWAALAIASEEKQAALDVRTNGTGIH